MLGRMNESVEERVDGDLEVLNRALERRIRNLAKKVKISGTVSPELTQAYAFRNQVLRQVFNERNGNPDDERIVSKVARGLREDV